MGSNTVSPARRVASHVLVRVWADQAFAERALKTALERTELSPRDRALATELVYGTLRQQILLDFYLSKLATKPLHKLPHGCLAALRLGAYQLCHSRVADYSAVNDAVSLARQLGRHAHLSGFVNAVLRRLAEQVKQGTLPNPEAELPDPVVALSVACAHPEWLMRRVVDELGLDQARAFGLANNETPRLSLRVNPLRTTRAALAEALLAHGATATLPELFVDGVLVKGGAVEALPGFAEGHFVVQDLAAQVVGRMSEAKPGQTVIDACAAPGGKTTHLAALMQDRGRVIALDKNANKLRLVSDSCQRLGLQSVTTHAVDVSDQGLLAQTLNAVGVAQVDGVVLDAPCSGTGTLRRRPELRSHAPADVAALTALQDRLLDHVAAWVRPGGFLVFSVCSVLPEEGRDRLLAFVARHPDFALDRATDPALTPLLSPDTGFWQAWPHQHPVDGFFAGRLMRKGL